MPALHTLLPKGKRFAALCAAVALSLLPLQPAAADFFTSVTEIPLNSPEGTADQPLTSVNLRFHSPAGQRNLIMYGVRENQINPLAEALSQYYGAVPENKPLKLTDPPFIDAEKYDNSDERETPVDSGFCWAASVSNMLWTSGWAKRYTIPNKNQKFASEDEVFSFYSSRFTNYGVESIAGAVDWFFMGEFYSLTYSKNAEPKTDDPTDGVDKTFVSSLIQARYDLVADAGQIKALELCDWTREGASVFQANIGSLIDGALYASEHAVTVAGIITDPSATSLKDTYRAILLIDSDTDAAPTAEQKAAEESHQHEDEYGNIYYDEDFLLESRRTRPNAVMVYPLELLEDANGTPYWHVVGYGANPEDSTWAIFALNRLPVYQEGLADSCRETEGNASVYTTVDLTLESLFTTREPEAIVDLYGQDEKELTALTFHPGEPVNLNFFIANRSAFALDDTVKNGGEVTVDWSVLRDADGETVASGRFFCEGILTQRIETGFMIHLNEKNGAVETWLPGAYTVTLDLNKARTLTESYYRNNLQKNFSFTILGETQPQTTPSKAPASTTPIPTQLPKTGDPASPILYAALVLAGILLPLVPGTVGRHEKA